jgi:hypothetical protein
MASRKAFVAIGDDAAEDREEQDGQLAEEVVETEVKGRLGQLEHQPALGDLLHPRADRGRERPEPENRKIAIGEGGKSPLQERRSEGGRTGRFE